MSNEDMSSLPYEIHDIDVVKIDKDNFKIIFGTKTDIEGFYKGFAELDVDRSILERFTKKVSTVL